MTADAAPLRVVFLSVSAEMGGSEVSLLSLVRGLRRQAPAWTLEAVVPRQGPLTQALEASGVRTHVMAFPESFRRIGEVSSRGPAAAVTRGASLLLAAGGVVRYGRALSRLLAANAPDVVHSNGFKMHVIGARSAPAASALVWHVHEYIAQRPVSRRLLSRYASRCDAIVANSHSVAAEIRALLPNGVEPATIYNAVDPADFAPAADRADLDALSGLPPAPPGTVRIGLVATYGRWKGHATFIEAMRRLPPELAVRGYIVGGALYDTAGSQYSRAELAAAIAAAGLQDRIGLTGFVERPAAVYRALDVVVHSSTQPEPFGLVIAEGLAAGRAVVVSAAGGAAELVRDGVDALTHPPGDADALSRSIARLAVDPGLRESLAANGRATALRLFDPGRFTESFMNVYSNARARVAAHGVR